MSTTQKNSFVMHNDYKQHFELLESPEQVRELLFAIFDYNTNGTIPEASPLVKMAFSFIKVDLDKAAEKYQKICERNRLNGNSGGRPKNPTKPKKPSGLNENPTKPKKPDNDNDNDNDNPPYSPPKGETFFSLIPENLKTETFKQTWKDWELYRIEKRKKLTKSSAEKQLNELSLYTPETAGAMINQSIKNGWVGLFELKSNPQNKKTNQAQQFNRADYSEVFVK